MKIRKAMLSAVASTGLLASVSHTVSAAGLNQYEACAIVPAVQWKSTEEFFAINLILLSQSKIHWVFFDVDGINQQSGSIPRMNTAANGFETFLWNGRSSTPELTQGGAGLRNRLGYLLFCADSNNDDRISTDGRNLTANAFGIDLANNDVVMIPTISVDEADLATELPAQWKADPVTNIVGGAAPAGMGALYVKYLVDFKESSDADNNNDTQIYIYTSGDPGRSQNAFLFNSSGEQRSVAFQANSRLTLVDPEALGTFPNFADGYFLWDVTATSLTSEVFGLGIVDAKDFGAVQTVIGSSAP